MNYTIDRSGVAPLVEISLGLGETALIQAGSMVYRCGDVELNARLNTNKGGIVGAIAKSATSGESMFITEISSPRGSGTITIAPCVMGEILELEVGQSQYRLNDGSFLAMDSSVTYNMKRQSVGRAVFGGQGGFFVMETTGQGTLLASCFGAIKKITLDGSAPMTFDNGHVVAWDASLDYKVGLQGGVLSSIKTGEGIVNTFSGSGDIYVQTLSLARMAAMMGVGAA